MNTREQAAPMSKSLLARVATLESALAAERTALAESRALVEQLTEERDHLRASHDRLRQELELLRRRILVAKAERVDSTQLELEFAQKLSALDALSGRLAEQAMPTDVGTGTSSDGDSKPSDKKPKGRRNLREANIAEVRVEIADPVFDELVRDGKAERIGFEASYKLAWQRGGHRRLVIARVKYRTVNTQKASTIETAPMPDETFPRSLAAPSMLAHIIAEKHLQGLPLYRLEARYSREGAPIDRGTMCRWLEDAGATAGSTVH
jgi:transposase